MEVLAVEGEALVGQRQLEDLEDLVEAGPGLVHVDAQGVVLATGQATTDADVQLALVAEDHLQHAHLLGELQRLPPRQHADHRADVDALRGAGDVGQQLQRIGDQAVRREVVLDGPQARRSRGRRPAGRSRGGPSTPASPAWSARRLVLAALLARGTDPTPSSSGTSFRATDACFPPNSTTTAPRFSALDRPCQRTAASELLCTSAAGRSDSEDELRSVRRAACRRPPWPRRRGAGRRGRARPGHPGSGAATGGRGTATARTRRGSARYHASPTCSQLRFRCQRYRSRARPSSGCRGPRRRRSARAASACSSVVGGVQDPGRLGQTALGERVVGQPDAPARSRGPRCLGDPRVDEAPGRAEHRRSDRHVEHHRPRQPVERAVVELPDRGERSPSA